MNAGREDALIVCFVVSCREYLTGFSKRKKARELNARSKAIDRDREEKNESRRAVSLLSVLDTLVRESGTD